MQAARWGSGLTLVPRILRRCREFCNAAHSLRGLINASYPKLIHYVMLLELIHISSNIRDDFRYSDRAPVAPRAQVLLLFVWFDPSRSSKIPKN
jgi:hypothetical protein